MLCLDPAYVSVFAEEVKGLHHRGHRGSQRETECYASITEGNRMLRLDPAYVSVFDEEVKGFHHRGHRGSQRETECCASIRRTFRCSPKKSRAFTTEGTEDHRGKPNVAPRSGVRFGVRRRSQGLSPQRAQRITGNRMLRLDPAYVSVFAEEVKGLHHRGHRGSQRETECCASIRRTFWCSTKKSRAFTTEGTEDHRGSRMLRLDPAYVLGFDEELKGFHHRGHRGKPRINKRRSV